MFLLPSAAWGQGTITVAGNAPESDGTFKDKNSGETIAGVTFNESTNTLTLEKVNITGGIVYGGTETLKLNLIDSKIEYDNAISLNNADYQQNLIINFVGNNEIISTHNNVFVGAKTPPSMATTEGCSNITFDSSSTGSLTLEAGLTLSSYINLINESGILATILSPGNETVLANATKAVISVSYGITVAGVAVTSANYEDILKDDSYNAGKVSFTPDNNILTLKSANITVNGKNAIESGLENLTVNLVGGDNVITCQGNTDCVFKGTVSGAKVTFTTDTTTPGVLTGVLTGGLSDDSNMFDGITPIYKNGLNFRREGNSYYIDTKVGLKIGDTEITSANIGSDGTITGISAISSGTVKFTPADNTTTPITPATLTLDNANFGPSLSGIVWSGNGTLKIQYSGNNIINTRNGNELNSVSSDGYCIFGNASSDLILSASDDASTLTLRPSSGGDPQSNNSRAAISGFTRVSLNEGWGMYYTESYAEADPEKSLTAGEEVVIVKDFLGIAVAGVPVTSSNASNIEGSNISFGDSGSISFDSENKILTLKNATIDYSNISANPIISSIENLKVKLIGINKINIANTSYCGFKYTGTNGTLTFVDPTSFSEIGQLTVFKESSSLSDANLCSGYTISNQFESSGDEYFTPQNSGWTKITPTTSYVKVRYVELYDLWIGGARISSNNLTGNGYQNYDPGTSSINYSGATSSARIVSNLPKLTIILSGENSLNVTDGTDPAISFTASEKTPTGILKFTKDKNSTSTINKMTIDCANGAIVGFSEVTTDDPLKLSDPAAAPATWDNSTTKVVITDETLYDLWVEGIRVTSGNKDNVKGEYSTNVNDPITPSVVFDGNNKLTLTNASITVTDKNAIESGIENLTVNLVGENIITCQGTNDVAFKAVGSGSKITFTTTSEYVAVSLYISGGISPIEGLDTDYENGLGFLYSSTDQRYSVETLKTPEIKKTAETEDGITVALVLPSGDKYSSNTTMYYKITYSDSDETTGFSEYSNAFTMTKPGTVTAYLVPLGGQSANAVAKYFGYPDAPYTLAVGDEITPAIYPAIDSNDGIEQSGASSGNEDIASFTYSDGIVKATGIGNTTLTATFTAGDQPFTVLNPIADPQAPHKFTATFSVIVGGSLSDYFEGSNNFGTFYNTDQTTTYAVPAGMKAYVITGVNGDKVITTETTVLPPNTVVLMDKGEGKAFTYIPATSGSAPTGNLLKRATSDVAVNTSSKLFVLYNDEYVKATAGSPIPAGKNYLDLSGVTAAGTRGFYNIGDGEDGTTGISEVKSGEVDGEKWADDGWHDLQGRRLSAKPTKPGLYILNGKKVVIK